jgi:hypothetical protein
MVCLTVAIVIAVAIGLPVAPQHQKRMLILCRIQACMARGVHGLPKVSPGPAQPFYALRVGHP